jgi:AcrR family transcriptional regulator
LAATLEILSTVGYDNLTIEAVARRAGVGRPTVYRRWSTKASLALAAVARSSGTPPTPNSGDLRDDLVALQRHQMKLMNSALFRAVAPALAAHFSTDAQLAESYVRDFVDLRRSAVRTVLDRAVTRGQLHGDLNVDLIYDALTGPLFYRAIVRGERLDRKFVEAVTDLLVSSMQAGYPAPAPTLQPHEWLSTPR